MSGWPVWLASASLRNRQGRTVTTGRWTPEQFATMEAGLDTLLAGVGDPEREREFRMNVTLCRHRALTQAEHDALPPEWHAQPAVDIAGGPVETLWSHGVPDTVATRPCENPVRVPLGDTWFPGDCGECDPCRARAAGADGACACQRG